MMLTSADVSLALSGGPRSARELAGDLGVTLERIRPLLASLEYAGSIRSYPSAQTGKRMFALV